MERSRECYIISKWIFFVAPDQAECILQNHDLLFTKVLKYYGICSCLEWWSIFKIFWAVNSRISKWGDFDLSMQISWSRRNIFVHSNSIYVKLAFFNQIPQMKLPFNWNSVWSGSFCCSWFSYSKLPPFYTLFIHIVSRGTFGSRQFYCFRGN